MPVRFAPEYIAYVLNENFEDAKRLFLAPLMAIHYAHLVMLADRAIIGPFDARRLREGLDGVAVEDVKRAKFDAGYEDLFFYVEACSSSRAARMSPGASTPRAAATTST